MYTYIALNDQNLLNSSFFTHAGVEYGNESAKFRGSLITLFAAPVYQTDDASNAYTYVIQVKDNSQNSWIFTIYEGPSGTAIGYNGIGDKETEKVAAALIDEIKKTKPSDYEEIVFYHDFGNKITYGCSNGVCYFHEELGNMDLDFDQE
ncbi:hypothetical protein A8709_29780 [Paenibacillus pectinilyticus]|uniref:Uncharacterized protein n=1 Tax=Paenibacillus pectinilyticus TaxID=512399 RepID=A0A1C0ZVB2_9BACL|nr:hypothetical protein [Paenibacillus pectinilyticus]OCT12046.1 hypothetical protein A8709_29780 [Paenibacillus pectinilyticus]